MDPQAAIDRILETENLTDGLEDNDANWLLDWGINSLPALIGEMEDEDAAGTKVNDLMSVMRKINQNTADRETADPQEIEPPSQPFLRHIPRHLGAPGRFQRKMRSNCRQTWLVKLLVRPSRRFSKLFNPLVDRQINGYETEYAESYLYQRCRFSDHHNLSLPWQLPNSNSKPTSNRGDPTGDTHPILLGRWACLAASVLHQPQPT
jgi:hypothetical protein